MPAIADNEVVDPDQSPDAMRGRMTREEVEELAELTARGLLGVSAEEAFAMLGRGELEGTHAASALRSLQFLLAA